MQTLNAELDKRIERRALEQSWQIDNQLSPRVTFDIDGTAVRITIFSTSQMPWDEVNFKRMFSIAVHRVAPICEINWS